MYDFKIKNSRDSLDASTSGGFLFLASLFTLGTVQNTGGKTIGGILLATAFFSRILLTRFRMPALVLQVAAAISMGLATQSLLFPAILLIFALVLKWSYVEPGVIIDEEQIVLVRSYHTRKYSWNQLNNVVLKDDLLTLDFKDNRVIQLSVIHTSDISENVFNGFCAGHFSQ